ncbi:MAG: flavin reductase family protein [archaeon]|jgi:flavin reductase (DIM6/NTAB) family NADH-FMN oxidoreductase RutF
MKKEFNPEQFSNLFPAPVVLVTCSDGEKDNIITIAWCGIVSSHPPTLSISIRSSRLSHSMIKESREFVVNVPSEDLFEETDARGIISGRDKDKFEFLNLKKEKSLKVKAPTLADCLISLECKVKQILPFDSHDCFIAEVVAVRIDDKLLVGNEIDFDKLKPFVLLSKKYFGTGKHLGDYGFSAKKLNEKEIKK